MPTRTSKQHLQVRKTLASIFMNLKMKDEHAIKWNGKTYLLDIFVPQFNVAFEVQGRQHVEYVPFMHGAKDNFARQKKLDVEKVQACIANGIKLIYIYHTDKITSDLLLTLIHGEDDERIATREHRRDDASDSNVDGSSATGEQA